MHKELGTTQTEVFTQVPVHPITTKCLKQPGGHFGCIPLKDFQLYTGSENVWQSVPDIFQAHHLIRSSGVPNFMDQRIPVASNLSIPSWRQLLCDYFDQQLVDLIQFGFSLALTGV